MNVARFDPARIDRLEALAQGCTLTELRDYLDWRENLGRCRRTALAAPWDLLRSWFRMVVREK
jgi:hypothetical protein